MAICLSYRHTHILGADHEEKFMFGEKVSSTIPGICMHTLPVEPQLTSFSIVLCHPHYDLYHPLILAISTFSSSPISTSPQGTDSESSESALESSSAASDDTSAYESSSSDKVNPFQCSLQLTSALKTYKLVGDNIDKNVNPRVITKCGQSLDYFHTYGVQDRVDLWGDENPWHHDGSSLGFSSNKQRWKDPAVNYTALVGRTLVKYVHQLFQEVQWCRHTPPASQCRQQTERCQVSTQCHGMQGVLFTGRWRAHCCCSDGSDEDTASPCSTYFPDGSQKLDSEGKKKVVPKVTWQLKQCLKSLLHMDHLKCQQAESTLHHMI